MTWDLERAKSGKHPWSWVEIEVDRCQLTYGTSPCTAAVGTTGDRKCFNGWHTCQDPVNYDPAPFFIRFGEPTSEIPRAFTFADAGLPVFLPFLRSVRHSPSLPDPGESMGLRVQLSVEISDAPHHDIGIDKYIAERDYDARTQGLFLRKLKARFPHYIGRRLRWYQGYIERGQVERLTPPGTLYLDFLQGTLTPRVGNATLAVTRAGNTGTRFNSAGVLEVVNANLPRFDYDPVTLEYKKVKVEPARTNSIRNNTMVGAVAGTPGTLPTNWTFIGAVDGLTREVVGSGTEDGISYVDVRYSGTTSAGTSQQSQFEPTTQIVAAPGQVWSMGCYVRLAAGSLNGITSNTLRITERDAAGVLQAVTDQSFTPTSAPLRTQRVELTRTLTDVDTARVSPHWLFSYSNGAAVDFTLRFGMPQIELGANCSSVIPTSSAAVTRNADVPAIATLGSWFNPAEGTIIVGFRSNLDVASRVARFWNGTTDERIDLLANTSGAGSMIVSDGGALQANFATSGSPIVADELAYIVGAYKASDFALSANGTAVTTDAAGTLPTVDRLTLGQGGAGSENINGHLDSFAYYGKRLSNAELQSLSATGPVTQLIELPTAEVASFRQREYIMERFEGPDAQGRVKIIAKDVLKLLDDDRAQAPAKSTGELAEDIADVDVITTLDITTEDDTEYDLIGSETEDYVRIGDEIFTYTGTTPISGGVQLTGVTRAAPTPYVTEADDHDIGDAVQRCRLFSGTVPAVVNELMVNYGGMDAGFIPFSEWEAEADTWAPEVISRLITEPEGVQSIVNEIIGQTLTWGFWFDEIEQEIKYRAVRPADVGDTVMTVTDDANLVAGSIRLVDKPDAIRNEVQVLYGQIDPNGSRDTIENYKRGIAVIDADSQSVNETGQRRLKRVFARWWPAASKSAVQQFTERTLSARVKNLMEIEFELERKDEDLHTASFADLRTLFLINDLGVPATTRVQVTRVDAAGERVKFRAREDFFKIGAGGLFVFGRLAPQALEGLEWTAASDDEKNRYMFLADTDEEFSNNDPGKRLA